MLAGPARQLMPRLGLVDSAAAAFQGLVWSAQWLRESEAAGAASVGLTLSELMVRAGSAAHDVCAREYPDARHCLILVGPGNNGGDGYVMARLFRRRNVRVTVWAVPTARPLPLEAQAAKAAWEQELGAADEGRGPVAPGVTEVLVAGAAVPAGVDLVVDGLLGTGISGAPRELYADVIARVNRLPVPRVAIDVPSGLNAETGAVAGECFRADHTVTFITLKPGLLTGAARGVVGRLHYSTLGLHEWLASPERRGAAHMRRLYADSLESYFAAPRPPCAHKGSNGRVCIVGGDEGFGGAAVMAAEAAVSCGAGLTTVVTRRAHVAPLLTRCPEAMTLTPDSPAELAETVRARAAQSTVLALGPGISTAEEPGACGLRPAVTAALEACGEACAGGLSKPPALVLDAGALDPALLLSPQGVGAPRWRVPRSIITPHPGEAARLLACTVAEVEADRPAAARRLAAVLGGVAVLKGAGTIVCEAADGQRPERLAVIDAGNAGMGVGGMGDTLTGILAALAGQAGTIPAFHDLFEVACAACLVHAVAADAIAGTRGERGIRPSELAAVLPHCINGGKL